MGRGGLKEPGDGDTLKNQGWYHLKNRGWYDLKSATKHDRKGSTKHRCFLGGHRHPPSLRRSDAMRLLHCYFIQPNEGVNAIIEWRPPKDKQKERKTPNPTKENHYYYSITCMMCDEGMRCLTRGCRRHHEDASSMYDMRRWCNAPRGGRGRPHEEVQLHV